MASVAKLDRLKKAASDDILESQPGSIAMEATAAKAIIWLSRAELACLKGLLGPGSSDPKVFVSGRFLSLNTTHVLLCRM